MGRLVGHSSSCERSAPSATAGQIGVRIGLARGCCRQEEVDQGELLNPELRFVLRLLPDEPSPPSIQASMGNTCPGINSSGVLVLALFSQGLASSPSVIIVFNSEWAGEGNPFRRSCPSLTCPNPFTANRCRMALCCKMPVSRLWCIWLPCAKGYTGCDP